jgi:hypothetical protein
MIVTTTPHQEKGASMLNHRALTVCFVFYLLSMLTPATAQTFPTGKTYIIQLTSSQGSSRFGEYLVPPLQRALNASGLVYKGDASAQYVATIETGADVGAWYGVGDQRQWLYTRFVTVGLSRSDIDVDIEGKLTPAFSVKVSLTTPDEDRVDELKCLIERAVREVKAQYRPQGQVSLKDTSCAR